jgi:ParB family chromosome partitioning protein
MSKRKNNIDGLLNSLKDSSNTVSTSSEKNPPVVVPNDVSPQNYISNPAIALASGANVKRAASIRQTVLHLEHDQVIFFKYHDRHKSSLDTIKVSNIRKSIESEGQHFPGVVRKTEKTTTNGRVIYELVIGRLRYEASRGVGVFNAFLKDISDSEAATLMITENEERVDITPFERWLSLLPLIDDKILGLREIARLTDIDPGNLSRSLLAQKVYYDCNFHLYLEDVSKVKLNALIEVSNFYTADQKSVKTAIAYVKNNHSILRNNLFLKAIIKQLKDTAKSSSEIMSFTGSKLIIKKVGDNLTLTFKGLPQESDFLSIIDKLKVSNSLK